MIDHFDGYYQKRLEDVYLLESAVEIHKQIFVPVGGKRVLGSAYFNENSEEYAYEALEILSKREGFPNIKVVPCLDFRNQKFWLIEWGERPKNWDELTTKERGRAYGYKESVLL